MSGPPLLQPATTASAAKATSLRRFPMAQSPILGIRTAAYAKEECIVQVDSGLILSGSKRNRSERGERRESGEASRGHRGWNDEGRSTNDERMTNSEGRKKMLNIGCCKTSRPYSFDIRHSDFIIRASTFVVPRLLFLR